MRDQPPHKPRRDPTTLNATTFGTRRIPLARVAAIAATAAVLSGAGCSGDGAPERRAPRTEVAWHLAAVSPDGTELTIVTETGPCLGAERVDVVERATTVEVRVTAEDLTGDAEVDCAPALDARRRTVMLSSPLEDRSVVGACRRGTRVCDFLAGQRPG